MLDVVVSAVAADSPTVVVSTVPLTVVFVKSISKIWLRTAIISRESGITVKRIIVQAAPKQFNI